MLTRRRGQRFRKHRPFTTSSKGGASDTTSFPSRSQVQKMLVVRNSMESSPKLVILTPSAVTAIPLSRCGAVGTCARCVALQDPYCGWDLVSSKCVSQSKFNSNYASEFLQNISVGRHRQCGDSESSVLIEEFKVNILNN